MARLPRRRLRNLVPPPRLLLLVAPPAVKLPSAPPVATRLETGRPTVAHRPRQPCLRRPLQWHHLVYLCSYRQLLSQSTGSLPVAWRRGRARPLRRPRGLNPLLRQSSSSALRIYRAGFVSFRGGSRIARRTCLQRRSWHTTGTGILSMRMVLCSFLTIDGPSIFAPKPIHPVSCTMTRFSSNSAGVFLSYA